MTKINLLMLAIAVVMMAGFASANTIISGKVTDGLNNPIPGATVDITCGMDTEFAFQSVTSNFDGIYSVMYDEEVCSLGDDVSIYSYKKGNGEVYIQGFIEESYPEGYWDLQLYDDSPVSTTIVRGNISNADFTRPVGNAQVIITCDSNILETTSFYNGTYFGIFDGSTCSNGNSLNVYAYKSGVGENAVTGEIKDNFPVQSWNLGLVNVPLVPEFGVIVGMITVFGALGMFFHFRKK